MAGFLSLAGGQKIILKQAAFSPISITKYVYVSLFWRQILFLLQYYIIRLYILAGYWFNNVVSFQEVGTVALNFSH